MALTPTPSLILDNHLYLSDIGVAKDLDCVESHKINVIINVSKEPAYAIAPHVRYLQFPIEDEDRAQIEDVFEPIFAELDAALERQERVLVHCRAGVSRSATVVIAYVMRHKRWSLKQALDYVRERRPIVCPNRGFMQKLVALDERLRADCNSDSEGACEAFDIDAAYVEYLISQGFEGEDARRALTEAHGDVDFALYKLVRQRMLEGAC